MSVLSVGPNKLENHVRCSDFSINGKNVQPLGFQKADASVVTVTGSSVLVDTALPTVTLNLPIVKPAEVINIVSISPATVTTINDPNSAVSFTITNEGTLSLMKTDVSYTEIQSSVPGLSGVFNPLTEDLDCAGFRLFDTGEVTGDADLDLSAQAGQAIRFKVGAGEEMTLDGTSLNLKSNTINNMTGITGTNSNPFLVQSDSGTFTLQSTGAFDLLLGVQAGQTIRNRLSGVDFLNFSKTGTVIDVNTPSAADSIQLQVAGVSKLNVSNTAVTAQTSLVAQSGLNMSGGGITACANIVNASSTLNINALNNISIDTTSAGKEITLLANGVAKLRIFDANPGVRCDTGLDMNGNIISNLNSITGVSGSGIQITADTNVNTTSTTGSISLLADTTITTTAGTFLSIIAQNDIDIQTGGDIDILSLSGGDINFTAGSFNRLSLLNSGNLMLKNNTKLVADTDEVNIQDSALISATGITFSENTTVSANLTVTGSLSKGAGSFTIDHPLDPLNKNLQHSFVESPDMMNLYSGIVQLDESGNTTVEFPEWFSYLNYKFTYQLTPIGQQCSTLYVSQLCQEEESPGLPSGNNFSISGGIPNMTVSYMVTSVRKDRYANTNRVQVEVDKKKQGVYLHPTVWV